MNNKIAKILKGYIKDLTWIDKISGLVQTVVVLVPNGKDSSVQKSYPVSCDITADACKKGAYQDLCPDSKKKSVLYFEDKGIQEIERYGNKIKFKAIIRLVAWLNLCLISDTCGSSGDYVIDVIKALPKTPFSTPDFTGISIVLISQAERDVSIFSKYTYSETAVQYLLYPYDFFALDISIEFTIPC